MPDLPPIVQEAIGPGGPGYGVGLGAAHLLSPGASVSDLDKKQRKHLLDQGSNWNTIGQLAGGTLGATLGATLGSEDGESLGRTIWHGVGGAGTGALVGGMTLPTAYGLIAGHRALKNKADELAEPIREKREAVEDRAIRRNPKLAFWATEHAKVAGLSGALTGGAIGGILGGGAGSAMYNEGPDRTRGMVMGTALGIPAGAVIGSEVQNANRPREKSIYEMSPEELDAYLAKHASLGGMALGYSKSLVPGLALSEGLKTPFIERTTENMNTPEARHPDYHMKGRALGTGLGAALGAVGGATLGALGGDAVGGDVGAVLGGAAGTAGGAVAGGLGGRVLGNAVGSHINGTPQPKVADAFSFLKKLAALSNAAIDDKGIRTRAGYHRWLATKRMQPAVSNA